jgi:hypothetical protein
MKNLAVAGLLALFTISAGHSQTTISAPIIIPLEIVTMETDGLPYYKYGIWASLGDSETPRLFEFDTGGDGFYAAWGEENSPWWGGPAPRGDAFLQKYGSGNTYTGYAATTTVSLFASGAAHGTALLTSGEVAVGQSSKIVNGSDTLWDSHSSPDVPPVQGHFYGDFGLSLKASTNSISNIFTQLNYDTNSVVAGFIVKAAPYGTTNGATVQVGIRPEQTNDFAFKFKMEGATDNGGTYSNYSAELIKVALALSSSNSIYSTNKMGINLDTGNPTPGFHTDDIPPDLLSGGGIDPGVLLQLMQSEGESPFFQLLAGTNYGIDYMYVESKNHPYLNIGAPFFQQYEVMFDFQNGWVGINPLVVPEARQAALMGVAVIGFILFAAGRRVYRRLRRN